MEDGIWIAAKRMKIWYLLILELESGSWLETFGIKLTFQPIIRSTSFTVCSLIDMAPDETALQDQDS